MAGSGDKGWGLVDERAGNGTTLSDSYCDQNLDSFGEKNLQIDISVKKS